MIKYAILCLAICAGVNGWAVSEPKLSQVRAPVDFTVCGSPSGELTEVDVTGCAGSTPCEIPADSVVDIALKFVPSTASSEAYFRIIAIVSGDILPVVEASIGSVSGGVEYTLTQSISVSSALQGQTVDIRSEIWDYLSGRIETCGQIRTTIV